LNGAAVQAFPEGDGPDRLELNSGVGDVSLYFGGMASAPSSEWTEATEQSVSLQLGGIAYTHSPVC